MTDFGMGEIRSTIHKQGYIREDEIPEEISQAFGREYGYERYFLPESGQPRMIPVVATSNALFGDVLRDFYRDRKDGEEAAPSTPTPAQKLVNDTLDQVRQTRVDLVEKLMVNPGFLSTFGNDFIVEFGDIETWINDNQDREFNSLNEIRLEVKHKIRIRERTPSESDIDKDLKEHSLRQNLEGNIESV